MIPVLIDAALRSLFVGLIVACGMRAFRIRNVFAQKAALGLVLVSALAMPLVIPIAQRLQVLPAKASIVLPAHPMTLLEELQTRIQAKSGSAKIARPVASNPLTGPIAAASPQPEKSSAPAADNGSAPPTQEPGQSSTPAAPVQAKPVIDKAQAAEKIQMAPQPRPVLSPSAMAFSIYIAVAAVLFLRLAIGLALTLRLWSTAVPIPMRELSELHAGLHLRSSTKVPSPLTIGSAILLPADFETWDKEKLRIVLAHERSHIRQGDFYLQVLAGLYAALVWFSPLGWWLKRELADLAEAISDRAGIEEAQSRVSYAQILLEFAAAPRPTALGVAMARSGSLTRRIERLLNDRAFRQSFAGGPRALVAVVLVPMALFAATALVRVQAASQSKPSARVALVTAPASSTPTLVATTVYPANQVSAEDTKPDNIPSDIATAAVPDATATTATSPEAETSAIATPELAAAQSAPNLFPVSAMARASVAQSQTDSNAMSFDRTLSSSGETQLMVATGSGNIHLKRGSENQIHIHGQIHVSHDGSEERAREIAANPPIEQSGNVIRVGQQHEQHWHGISIDYDIEAPTGTLLEATSGSGDVVDEGVGKNAKLQTGSGDIRATGLQGAFIVMTGSGNITAEQTGQGDVKAETGSGNIEIKDIHGSFRGQTGSGDIKATGTPSAPWTLETGSGNVELWTNNAPLTLDGSTGSGSVTTDHEMLVKGSLNQHHITGNLNGGGPLVRVQTGSGDIQIH
jgi:beta-lactamase regulating signal transducer with metallopeptidase domain